MLPLAHEDRPSRGTIARSVARSLAIALVFSVVYVNTPARDLGQFHVVLMLVAALFVFSGMVVWQVKAIIRSDYPGLRASEALITILFGLLAVFALIYLAASASDQSAFSEPLNHMSSMYFTVSTFGTVGFGDIVPTNDTTQLLVMIQILIDLVIIGGIARVIMMAASSGRERKRQSGVAGGEDSITSKAV